MKKTKLDVSELRVDSFAVSPEMGRGRGTVLGWSATYTLPIPYGLCTSQNETHDGCPSGEVLPTCHHTVCDCDQDPNTLEC